MFVQACILLVNLWAQVAFEFPWLLVNILYVLSQCSLSCKFSATNNASELGAKEADSYMLIQLCGSTVCNFFAIEAAKRLYICVVHVK